MKNFIINPAQQIACAWVFVLLLFVVTSWAGMCFYMDNYNKYKEKILNADKLSQEKKDYYLKVAERVNNNGFPIILNSYHLSNLVGIKWDILKKLINDNVSSYHKFYITKKDRISKREILAPSQELSYVQKYICTEILNKVRISDACYGFVSGKNIIDNAKKHLNSEMILNIDLKDFFPSISSDRVYYIFNKLCGYDKTLSFCLTKLVTYRNMVPQGACTSPIISNIVLYMLDIRLLKLAEKNNINYTRYADDITFSGTKNQINHRFYSLVRKIVEDEGFKINDKKVHFSSESQRQEVTGLIINNGNVRIKRNYIRKIEQELYYIGKFGLENHIKNMGTYNAFYVEHLKGKIMFVREVNIDKGNKLLGKFNSLNLQ